MNVRTISVLFTDIVDSTRLLGGLPGRRADAVRSAHYDTLRAALDVHHGTEVKTLGDGILAVFDAADSALACAAAMQRSVTTGPRLVDVRLSIRIGVSTGDARPTADGDWHGPVVVEASRLCGQASRGQTLVAGITRALARGSDHVLEEQDRRVLRGIDDPVEVFELRWEAGVAPIRVVLADDSSLVRDGVARLLDTAGFEVVAQLADARTLVEEVVRVRPDVVISDIRMPPDGEAAGVIAAEAIAERVPGTAILLLSSSLERRHARRLLAASGHGVGYLSKDRVADMSEFAIAVRTVAAGGTVFDISLGVEAVT